MPSWMRSEWGHGEVAEQRDEDGHITGRVILHKQYGNYNHVSWYKYHDGLKLEEAGECQTIEAGMRKLGT